MGITSIFISDNQVSTFREVLLNGETTLDSYAKTESSSIKTEIDRTEVPQAYSGPHIIMPLTLETVQNILDHFKKGGVSNAKIFLLFLLV